MVQPHFSLLSDRSRHAGSRPANHIPLRRCITVLFAIFHCSGKARRALNFEHPNPMPPTPLTTQIQNPLQRLALRRAGKSKIADPACATAGLVSVGSCGAVLLLPGVRKK